MALRLPFMLLAFFWSVSLNAQEEDPQFALQDSMIFIGEFDRKTIIAERSDPITVGNCEGEGDEQICEITVMADGACGWERAEFDVHRNLKGAEGKKHLVLNTYLNSWCKSSVEVSLDEVFVMALKRRVPSNPGVKEEFFIRTFQVMEFDGLGKAVFLETPSLVEACSRILGIDCFLSMRPIEPWNLPDQRSYDGGWQKYYREFLEKGIMTIGPGGEVYVNQVLDVEDLISRLEEQN